MTEYYKCVKNIPDFTIGKIYKIRNPSNLEDSFNFIDDRGRNNGNRGNNYKHFSPATLEEWLKQENITLDYSYLIPILKTHNIR